MKFCVKKWLLPLLIVSPFCVSAQTKNTYPEKPIRIIVPFAAGGATDALLRLLQDPVSSSLGQPLVIENKGGAAGAIGARQVANATPDGYTLLVTNTGLAAITPYVQKNTGLDTLRSFSPVARLTSAPSVLLVNSGVPANNIREFIDYAKANPGKLEYAVVGKGAFGDLTTSLFASQAGIRMLPLSYQGNAQTTLALLSGEAKMQLTILSGSMNEHIREGKIKALGVATLTPSPLVPGIPLISEVLPNFEAVFYTGLLAPANTPPEIVDKLSLAFTNALSMPSVQQQLITMGMESAPMQARDYATHIKREIDTFKPVISNLQTE